MNSAAPFLSDFDDILLVSYTHLLEWLAHHLGCTLANVIAIGDSENDLTMLQMAGLGVAMANSEPCIREAADVITGDEKMLMQAPGCLLYTSLIRQDPGELPLQPRNVCRQGEQERG